MEVTKPSNRESTLGIGSEGQFFSREDFLPLLAAQAGDLPLLANGLMESNPEQWTQRQLHHLYGGTTDLEAFLDAHQARQNKAFFRIREIVALVRWLAAGTIPLLHLHSRLHLYSVPRVEWAKNELSPELRKAALELGEIIGKTLQGLRDEWVRCELAWPDGALRMDSLGQGKRAKTLPKDRVSAAPEREWDSAGARLAGTFLTLAEGVAPFLAHPRPDAVQIREFMQRFCTEEMARKAEARIHSFQSSYDTHVAGSAEEENHPSLETLRGLGSMALHFSEMVTALTHLYERHDFYDRQGESRQVFRAMVGEDKICSIIVNYGIKNGWECMNEGIPIAKELISALTLQGEVELELPEGVQLHARPLSLFAHIAQKHGTPLTMVLGGESANAASIMQMLILAGSHTKYRKVTFVGDQAPLKDIQSLFEARLGEDGMEDFPTHLGYLRPT